MPVGRKAFMRLSAGRIYRRTPLESVMRYSTASMSGIGSENRPVRRPVEMYCLNRARSRCPPSIEAYHPPREVGSSDRVASRQN